MYPYKKLYSVEGGTINDENKKEDIPENFRDKLVKIFTDYGTLKYTLLPFVLFHFSSKY